MGVAARAPDPRQQWTFSPDTTTKANLYDGQLVNAEGEPLKDAKKQSDDKD